MAVDYECVNCQQCISCVGFSSDPDLCCECYFEPSDSMPKDPKDNLAVSELVGMGETFYDQLKMAYKDREVQLKASQQATANIERLDKKIAKLEKLILNYIKQEANREIQSV